jgi:hypothetical protein
MLIDDIAHQVKAASARTPREGVASIARAHAVAAIPRRAFISGSLQPSVRRVCDKSYGTALLFVSHARRDSGAKFRSGLSGSLTPMPRMYKLSHRTMRIAVPHAGRPRALRSAFDQARTVPSSDCCQSCAFWTSESCLNRSRRRACERLSAAGSMGPESVRSSALLAASLRAGALRRMRGSLN